MIKDLEGKIAIVTGAGSGIGAATARAFAGAGARVALFDRDVEAARSVAAALAGAQAYEVDVAAPGSVRAAITAAGDAFGGVDVLVNNAGIESGWTIENMPEEDWDRVLAVNLKGAMLCTQAVIPAMRAKGGGAIVNVASVAGKRMSYHGGASYTASKAGMLGFTRHAAFELGGYGIRVNAVCPGPTLTPMVERNTTEAERTITAKMVPLGRWIKPEEIAQAILFLASGAAAMCTGAALDVDGGMLVSNGSSYVDYFARRT